MHMYLSETEVPTILVGLSSFPPLYMTIVWGDRGHNFRRTHMHAPNSSHWHLGLQLINTPVWQNRILVFEDDQWSEASTVYR